MSPLPNELGGRPLDAAMATGAAKAMATAKAAPAAMATSAAKSASSMSSSAKSTAGKMSCPAGKTYVNGYTKQDGTKVAGYCRSMPSK